MEDYEEEMMSSEEFNRRLNAVYDQTKVNAIVCGVIVGSIGIVFSYFAVQFL